MSPEGNQPFNTGPDQPSVPPVNPPQGAPVPPAQGPMPMQTPPPQPFQHPVGAAAQPAVSYAQTSGSKSKLKVIIISAVAGVVLIGGVVAAIMMFGGDDEGNGGSSSLLGGLVGGSSDVVDRTDGTLDLSDKVDGQQSVKEQDITGELNQQVNTGDGFSFMVTKVSTIDSYQYTSLGRTQTKTPASGNELIEVSYVVGNRLEDGTLRYSPYTFALTDSATGEAIKEESFLSSDDLMPDNYYKLDLGPLEAGDQHSFILYYEVPKGSSLYTLRERKMARYADGEREEVTLAGRINLR